MDYYFYFLHKRLYKRIFFLAFIALFFSASEKSYAHPHVFIDCKILLEVKDNKLTGIIQQWTFDEMFSSVVIADYDTNRNKRIDGNEIKVLQKEYFEYLANFSFFTKAYIGNKTVTFKKAYDFMPMIDKGKLIYHFRLNVDNIPVEGIKIAVFDETYYSDVKISDFSFSTDSSDVLDIKKVVMKDISYYFDQVHPEAVTVLKRK